MSDRDSCFRCPRPAKWVLRLANKTVYRSCGTHLHRSAEQATHWGQTVTIERFENV